MALPIIPPEGSYGAIEHDFIENEPPGLFPTDQNSYWGQSRKVFTDHLQALADKFNQWYANLDPATTNVDDMPEWEYMLGIPDGTGKPTESRRSFIQARLERGPFTKTRRRKIVESFVVPTFGEAITFDAFGVPFTAGGIPFFSGVNSLVGAYSIVDNTPFGRNKIANGSFGTNTVGWANQAGGVMTRVNTASKYLLWSLQVVCAATDDGVSVAVAGLTPGATYTFSVWVKAAATEQVRTTVESPTGTGLGFSNVITGNGAWQQEFATFVAGAGGTATFRVVSRTGAQTFNIDGAQLETGSTVHEFVDASVTPFFYEVRILNTIALDTVGLVRELERVTPAGIDFSVTATATP